MPEEKTANSLDGKLEELETENKGLRKAVEALKKQNAEYKDTILEYQYILGEKKRPLDEKTLVEYLDALNDPEKVKDYKSKNYIVTRATIVGSDFKKDPWFLFLVSYLYIDVLDQQGNTTRFTDHLYNRDKKEDFIEKLEKLKGTEVSLVVSTDIGSFGGKYYHFDKIITKEEVIDFNY